MTKEYKQSLTEVNEILKNSSIEVIKKIPYRFRKYLIQNMDKSFKVTIQTDKPITEQNISECAKNILALIYRDYLVSAEERTEYISKEKEIHRKNELAKMEKYNPDDIFKNRKRNATRHTVNENNLPMVINQEKGFFKLLKKILDRFFR